MSVCERKAGRREERRGESKREDWREEWRGREGKRGMRRCKIQEQTPVWRKLFRKQSHILVDRLSLYTIKYAFIK